MVYNRAKLMQRRFFGSARLLFILVLLVTLRNSRLCRAAAAGDGGPGGFRARGGRGDRARQARRRGEAGDGARRLGSGGRGRARAARRRRAASTSEAQALLEPIAAREPAGEAALELALLYRTIGRERRRAAAPHRGLPAGRRRRRIRPCCCARRAPRHALNRPRDAKTFFLEAGARRRRSGDRRDRVGRLLPREVPIRPRR